LGLNLFWGDNKTGAGQVFLDYVTGAWETHSRSNFFVLSFKKKTSQKIRISRPSSVCGW